jgi:hypothetical protein
VKYGRFYDLFNHKTWYVNPFSFFLLLASLHFGINNTTR